VKFLKIRVLFDIEQIASERDLFRVTWPF